MLSNHNLELFIKYLICTQNNKNNKNTYYICFPLPFCSLQLIHMTSLLDCFRSVEMSGYNQRNLVYNSGSIWFLMAETIESNWSKQNLRDLHTCYPQFLSQKNTIKYNLSVELNKRFGDEYYCLNLSYLSYLIFKLGSLT